MASSAVGEAPELASPEAPADGERPLRFVLSGVVNNPRPGWLEYFGLPEDIDEWTLDDLRGSVSSLVSPAGASAVSQPERRQEIGLADFRDYLRRVGEPYRFLAANRRAGAAPLATDAAAETELANGSASASMASAAAPAAAAEGDLSGIPAICFREDFDLTDPATFATFDPPEEHSAMLMVERLSNYLDQVELKLLGEVSSRAEGFFEALVSYDRLAQEVASGVATIGAMRQRLRALERNLVEKTIVLPRLSRRRANADALLQKLRLVHAVWRTQPTIQQLLTSGDFPNALELIASSQNLLATELAGVSSLAHVHKSLVETKALIEQTMQTDLVRVALGYDPAAGPPAEPVEALASELDFKLAPLATGLLRLRSLHEPMLTLQEMLKKDVRTIAKHKLQEHLATQQAIAKANSDLAAASADGGGGASPSCNGRSKSPASGTPAAAEEGRPAKAVAVQLKELSVEGFDLVMGGLTAPLMVVLRRAAAVNASLLKLLAATAAAAAADGGDGAGEAAGGEEAAEAEDAAVYRRQVEEQAAEMVRSLCDLVHERYAKLLRARKEVHARLPLAEFVKVNRMVTEFVRDVQHLSGSPGHTLTAEIQAHAKTFMDAHCDDATSKLEAIVELEQWKQVDVAPEFQEIVDAITCNQVPRVQEAELLRLREQQGPPADAVAAAKEVVVAGAGYKVVGSGLLLLDVLTHCLQCLSSVKSVASQVARILPALLKKFHTKAYQQVLMAGAMRPESAGLKSINAKHIALSSQSLGLVLALLPHLKAILAAYVPEGQRRLLTELDTTSADYEEHQQQLFAKLVSILEDRRREHMKTIKEVLTPSENPRQPEPSANVRAVVKDLSSMYKQLQPLLTRQQLHTVFSQILSTFDAGLLEAYRTVDTAPAYARQCVVQDVHYIRKEVAKLHLSLPQGCCPQLVAFAQGLPLA